MTDAQIQKRWESIPLRLIMPALEKWLTRNFPAPYPIKVRYAKKIMYDGYEIAGLCYREGRYIVIRTRAALSRRERVETLIHEWSHAHTLRHENMEKRLKIEHTPEWGLAYAAIHSELFDKERRVEIMEEI